MTKADAEPITTSPLSTPRWDTVPMEFTHIFNRLDGGIRTLFQFAASPNMIEPEAMAFVAHGLDEAVDELVAKLRVSKDGGAA